MTLSTGSSKCRKGATKFSVRSHEDHNRNYHVLIPLVAVILGTLCHVDPQVQHEVLWILGGLGIALALLETAPMKHHVELIIDIGPLGIQRTTKLNGRSTHHPLLPRECVQDCIITEHVGAFGVSNHLVLRVESKLIPVFPNAKLSFAQCQSLLKQVQTALREV